MSYFCSDALIARFLPVECKDSHCGLTIAKDFQESAGDCVQVLQEVFKRYLYCHLFSKEDGSPLTYRLLQWYWIKMGWVQHCSCFTWAWVLLAWSISEGEWSIFWGLHHHVHDHLFSQLCLFMGAGFGRT